MCIRLHKKGSLIPRRWARLTMDRQIGVLQRQGFEPAWVKACCCTREQEYRASRLLKGDGCRGRHVRITLLDVLSKSFALRCLPKFAGGTGHTIYGRARVSKLQFKSASDELPRLHLTSRVNWERTASIQHHGIHLRSTVHH